MAQSKRKTKRNGDLDIKLSVPQTALLQKIAPSTQFQMVEDHRKTQQALIDRELAVADKSGSRIKLTAKGRRVAKSL